jgi:hypothetical protein
MRHRERVVKDTRRTRKVFGAFNSIFISLIPKKDNLNHLMILGLSCYFSSKGISHYVTTFIKLELNHCCHGENIFLRVHFI